jgi:hypothetical protein
VRLDLDLSAQLVLHARLDKLRLLNHLDGHDELALALPSQVYVAEFTVSEGAAYLEVFQGPMPKKIIALAHNLRS